MARDLSRASIRAYSAFLTLGGIFMRAFLQSNTLLAVGLVIPTLLGCGDDVSALPDAPVVKPIDAPPDAPPLPAFKGFDADEGGEVRVEYVINGNNVAGARATAFLWKNVGTTKFFPFLNLNGCTDMRGKTFWPMATNPIAERVYLDPGRVIVTGGPSIYEIPRNPAMANDPFARTHPANQWFFEPYAGGQSDGPNFLPEKTKFDVTFTGSADMPAQIFDDVLYTPANFAPISPALSVTPHPIPAATAQTFTFTTPADSPPPGYRVDNLVAFTGPNGPAVVCIEPADGSITVPAAMIDIARTAYPGPVGGAPGVASGTLARQTLTHVVRELKDNTTPVTRTGGTGKRIDFITVWCYATPFSSIP